MESFQFWILLGLIVLGALVTRVQKKRLDKHDEQMEDMSDDMGFFPTRKEFNELRDNTGELYRHQKSIREHHEGRDKYLVGRIQGVEKRMEIWEQEIRDRVAAEKAAKMFHWVDGCEIKQVDSFLYRGVYIQDGEKCGFQIQLPYMSDHIQRAFNEFKNPAMCSIEALSALLELYAGFIITGEEAIHIQPAATEEVFEPNITATTEEVAG